MIKKIELAPIPADTWGTGHDNSEASVINKAKVMAMTAICDYQMGVAVLDVLSHHKRGSIAEPLGRLLSAKNMLEVHHISPLKRVFTIGLLSITEED